MRAVEFEMGDSKYRVTRFLDESTKAAHYGIEHLTFLSNAGFLTLGEWEPWMPSHAVLWAAFHALCEELHSQPDGNDQDTKASHSSAWLPDTKLEIPMPATNPPAESMAAFRKRITTAKETITLASDLYNDTGDFEFLDALGTLLFAILETDKFLIHPVDVMAAHKRDLVCGLIEDVFGKLRRTAQEDVIRALINRAIDQLQAPEIREEPQKGASDV
jgi:hypothetical protein